MPLTVNPTLRLFIGAALISLSPVWVKLVSVSPTSSGFYRVLIGGLALAVYLVVSGRRLQLSRRTWQVLLLAAVFLALDLWLWHRSINYIGPGLSTLLANFQVFIMTAAGIVLLRQAPRPLQLLAIPLAFFGLSLIVGLDWQGLPGDYRLGVIFGLLTAVTYACYLLSLRAAMQGSAHRLPTREVAVISLVTAALLGVSAFVEGESLGNHRTGGRRVAGLLRHPVSLYWLVVHRQQPAACVHHRGRTRTAVAAHAEFRLGRAVLCAADECDGTCRCSYRAVCDFSGRATGIKAGAGRSAIA